MEPNADHQNFFVVRRLADGSVFRLGTVSHRADGYRFFPNVFGKQKSTRAHQTMRGCLPKWVGYPHACETLLVGKE